MVLNARIGDHDPFVIEAAETELDKNKEKTTVVTKNYGKRRLLNRHSKYEKIDFSRIYLFSAIVASAERLKCCDSTSKHNIHNSFKKVMVKHVPLVHVLIILRPVLCIVELRISR
jgi:hypothetical protein